MILSDQEWGRLYVFTCRIIASQFTVPVPASTVPGLFLRAFVDRLVEQAGYRLHVLRAVAASSAVPDPHLTVWMHPQCFERLSAGHSDQFGLLKLARGGRGKLHVRIAAHEAARPNELWVSSVGWNNIQTSLQVTDSLVFHRFCVWPLPREEKPETALEATVSVLWCRDMADLTAGHLAAIVANYFAVPRYFVPNAVAAVDIKACLGFDNLAAYNCLATNLFIRVTRSDPPEGKSGGFFVDKTVTRLFQTVVKKTPLPGCPLVRPSHSLPVWNEMTEIVSKCTDQVGMYPLLYVYAILLRVVCLSKYLNLLFTRRLQLQEIF
jgi:hypothetical protein